jgi:hypothetical protein
MHEYTLPHCETASRIGAANDVIIGCIAHEQKIIAFFAISQKEIWAVLKGILR